MNNKKIEIKKIKQKQSLSLHSFVLRRVAFLFFLLTITFLVAFYTENLAHTLQEKKTRLFFLDEQERRLEELKTELEERNEKLVKIEGFFPKEKEIVGFINFLDKFSLSGISITAFHFEKEEPLLTSEGYPFLPFSLVLAGQFEDLKKFLDQFLSGPYLIKPYFGEIKSSDNILKSGVLTLRGRFFVNQNFR